MSSPLSAYSETNRATPPFRMIREGAFRIKVSSLNQPTGVVKDVLNRREAGTRINRHGVCEVERRCSDRAPRIVKRCAVGMNLRISNTDRRSGFVKICARYAIGAVLRPLADDLADAVARVHGLAVDAGKGALRFVSKFVEFVADDMRAPACGLRASVGVEKPGDLLARERRRLIADLCDRAHAASRFVVDAEVKPLGEAAVLVISQLRRHNAGVVWRLLRAIRTKIDHPPQEPARIVVKPRHEIAETRTVALNRSVQPVAMFSDVAVIGGCPRIAGDGEVILNRCAVKAIEFEREAVAVVVEGDPCLIDIAGDQRAAPVFVEIDAPLEFALVGYFCPRRAKRNRSEYARKLAVLHVTNFCQTVHGRHSRAGSVSPRRSYRGGFSLAHRISV